MFAYLSIGYSSRQSREAEIGVIRRVLAGFNIHLFIFVDEFRFSPSEERQMMQQAFLSINACSLFIAEVSEKAIGVGVETGYAAALGKPVIYLRQATAAHSTTASGAADHSVIYQDLPDLENRLKAVLQASSGLARRD